MDETSSYAASPSESEISDDQNRKAGSLTEEVDNTETLLNGNKEPFSNGETLTEMDGVLQEESKRLDEVISKSKEKVEGNYAPQVK